MTLSKKHESASTKVSCLLVDDIAENLVALRALLEKSDIEILCAQSGSQALEILLSNDVALAIIDVQMPEMNGFELAELMRGSERTRDVPIFFLTAGSRDEHRLFRGYEAGAVDFIYKPIEPDILRNKANVFFQLHRQKQQLAWELRERTEALRLNEMFMAVLGHDLRSPLSSIVAGTEFILQRAGDDKIKQFVGHILSSTARMTRMIEDLLDVTRSRVAGGLPIRLESMNLSDVLNRVLSEIRTIRPDRQINAVTIGNLEGMWDAERLAQVISNLINNALQHGKKDHPVMIELEGTNASKVMIQVRNAGIIAEHRRHGLFNPFHRADQMACSREGLGLGLYIVKEIVRAHGGDIDVHTDTEETIFAVRLPRKTLTAVQS